LSKELAIVSLSSITDGGEGWGEEALMISGLWFDRYFVVPVPAFPQTSIIH
jgi:hypothetical protein